MTQKSRRTALITSAITGKIDVRGLVKEPVAWSLHKEISFEDEVCDHLAAHDWLHADGDAVHYDRALALYRRTCWHGWAQEAYPKTLGGIDQEPRFRTG